MEQAEDPYESKPAFKALVVSILEDNELISKRAAKMEILDFLSLLSVMNKAGIHFS